MLTDMAAIMLFFPIVNLLQFLPLKITSLRNLLYYYMKVGLTPAAFQLQNWSHLQGQYTVATHFIQFCR